MREVSLLSQMVLVVIGSMMVLNALVPREAQGMTQETSTPEQTDVSTLFAETLELPSLIRAAVARSPKS